GGETGCDVNATGGHDRLGRAQLTGAFATPRWLRDLGRSSWLLVGVLALVIGLVWLLAETYTIVGPMACALIVSGVAMPLVQIWGGETGCDVNATGGHDRLGRAQLTGAFATPRWLRDLGRSSWLLVGVLALVIGLVWLLAETYTIVGPMVCALIVSVVAMPLVRILDRHMPRAIAAALVLLAVAAVTVLIAVVVVAGITGQNAELSAQAASG